MSGPINSTSPLGPAVTIMTDAMKTARQGIENLQQQIATDQKLTSFIELPEKAGLVAGLENFIANHNAELDKILITNPLFQLSQHIATSLRGLTEELHNLNNNLLAKSPDQIQIDFQTRAANILNMVKDFLNTKEDGVYLCSGSKINQLPVDLTLLPNPATYALNDTDDKLPPNLPTYYKGDNLRRVLKIEDQGIEYSFTANELGPQRLIRAAHILSTADKTAVDFQDRVQEVRRLTLLSQTDFRNIEAEFGENNRRIDAGKKDINSLNNKTLTQLQEIVKTDRTAIIAELMSENTHYSAIIGASKAYLERQEDAIRSILGA